MEFFANFRPPSLGPCRPTPSATPGQPTPRTSNDTDPDYINVSLGVINGTAAEVAPNPGGAVIKLDGNPDLSGVIVDRANNPTVGPAPPAGAPLPQRRQYLYDTLWLKEGSARSSKTFRIVAVDNAHLHAEGLPNLGGKMNQLP